MEELLLGRRVKLPAIAEISLWKTLLFKINEKTKTIPVASNIRKALNTFFKRLETSIQTILVSECQTTRLHENNVKNGLPVLETISQSES